MEQRTPKVSVIIPTYNRAAMLVRAIRSVLNQSYDNYEIIVVDDGSTDETSQQITTFEKKIKFIQIPHSGLPAVTRNTGIRESTGNFIAFLDSDDVWLPEKLKVQIEYLDTHPSVGLVCSNAYIDSGMGLDHFNEQILYIKNFSSSFEISVEKLVGDNIVITSSAVVRRTILDKTRHFSKNKALRALEDFDLWLQIGSKSKIFFINTPLVIYRDSPKESIRSQQTYSGYWMAMLLILTRNFLQLFFLSSSNWRIKAKLLKRIATNLLYYIKAIIRKHG